MLVVYPADTFRPITDEELIPSDPLTGGGWEFALGTTLSILDNVQLGR